MRGGRDHSSAAARARIRVYRFFAGEAFRAAAAFTSA
jgi:hypothetical protein